MRKVVGLLAVTGVLAAALLILGAVALRPGTEDPSSAPFTPAPEPASLLLRQGVGAGSVEADIAGLQRRLREIPSDWPGFASLGIAYVAQARTTGDPSL